MKRTILIIVILALLLSGCGSGNETSTQSASSAETIQTLPGSREESTETEAPTTEAPSTEEPTTVPTTEETTAWETLPEWNEAGKRLIDNRDPEDRRPALAYEFNPHVISELDVKAFGETAKEVFFAYCDAVLAGEDSFPCPDEKCLEAVFLLQRRLFPLGIFVTPESDCEGDGECGPRDGRCPLIYQIPKEELRQKAEEFKQCVAGLIAEADLREGDTDLEKALKLYTMLSLRTCYDYEAMLDENMEIELSAYRTLMTGWGICQEIAPAYGYLLLQVGVESNTCGGLAKDSSFAHEWTLVRIDGVYYHADVTYQLDTPYGLQYFLTTDGERDEQDLDVPYFNIGDSNKLWHKDLPMTDETYQPLWSAVWYRIDHAARRIRYLPNRELKGELTEVPSPDRLEEYAY